MTYACNRFASDVFPRHGITFNKVVSHRDEEVIFSLVEPQTSDVKISGEIHDKGLGSSKNSLYVPELRSTGSFANPPAELTDYVPRVITGQGLSITTNLYFPGPIEVKCTLEKGPNIECLMLVYHPKISRRHKLDVALLRVKRKNIKCAPIFTTQKFCAAYEGHNSENLICSQLILEEEGNKIGKIVFATEDDPVICEHTGQTEGVKFLTYTVGYDDGYRAVSRTISESYEIDRDEIRDKDDFIISSPEQPQQPLPETPPKIYVICTKRCWTDCSNVAGTYDAKLPGNTGPYDYA